MHNSVLRLAAISLEALVGFETPAFSGFGVLFGVSLPGDHGALFHSV
jgi:hypothetical protein